MSITHPDPLLIGLVGPSGAGKTTAADYLEDAHDFVQAAFADALKDMLEALMTGCNVDYAHLHEPALKARPIAELHDVSPRRMMQTLGDWGRFLAPDWWVTALAHRIGMAHPSQAPVHDRIVLSDVRYLNEAAWIMAHGGRLVRIHRAVDSLALHRHSSETEQHAIDTWCTLDNTADVHSLKYQIDAMLADGWPAMFEAP